MFASLLEFIKDTGFANLAFPELIMIVVALILLYLGIEKKYEPLLLVPISFGMLLVNLPLGGLMTPPADGQVGGLFYYLYQGIELGIYPPLIFLGVGAMTDFGPLIANPVTLLLGAAAQLGIFTTFLGALLLGFALPEAGSIGIIGGADGPTAIYLTSKMAPHLLGAIAIAAYSYMALGAHYPAADYEGADYGKRKKDSDAATAACFQNGKSYFPHRCHYPDGALSAGGDPAFRYADVWQPASGMRGYGTPQRGSPK